MDSLRRGGITAMAHTVLEGFFNIRMLSRCWMFQRIMCFEFINAGLYFGLAERALVDTRDSGWMCNFALMLDPTFLEVVHFQ